MKQILIILTLFITSMGLFGFLKKKKTETQNSIILGMVLLNETNSLKTDGLISELKNKWDLKVTDAATSDETSVIDINGHRVAIASIPAPIPTAEIKSATQYNYFWQNGVKETSKHKGHIIISLMNSGKKPIQENLLFSKIASAVMNNSNAIGIYIGSRTLVLEKEFYQSNVQTMSEDDLPLAIWIYVGLRSEKGKQSVYTYGLIDFGKKEMEIVDSDRSLDELNEMIFNVAHYVLAFDVNLNSGETLGFSEEQKLKITESKGRYVEGTTLKIDY